MVLCVYVGVSVIVLCEGNVGDGPYFNPCYSWEKLCRALKVNMHFHNNKRVFSCDYDDEVSRKILEFLREFSKGPVIIPAYYNALDDALESVRRSFVSYRGCKGR
jgi:hypothetical protein